MSLDKQIITILFSFLFGMFFFICMKLNYKIMLKNKILKILITFILILLETFIYFYILLKINYGIIHLYEVISILIGYFSVKYIIKLIKRLFYKIIKK